MEFIDTHCHIQSAGLDTGERHTRELWAKIPDVSADGLIKAAHIEGVAQMICVGCDVEDSILAIETVKTRENLFASIGIHPHEAKEYVANQDALDQFAALATDERRVPFTNRIWLD